MGKYDYKTNFEEAIKRGITPEQYARESSKLTILNWIANELAEANKLKRLEIKQFVTQSIKTQEAIMLSNGGSTSGIDKSSIQDFEKELEDRA